MANNKKFLKAFVFAVLLMLSLEACLRIANFPVGSYVKNRFQSYVFDPVIGWKTRPNTKFLRVSSDYIHYNFYNPDGFPCTKADHNKPLNKDRESIVLLGNSYVEGYYLPYEKSFANLISIATGVQVVNLGVSGYTPPQILLAARERLPQFKNVKKIFVFYYPYQDIKFLKDDFYYDTVMKPVFGEDLTVPKNVPLRQIAHRRNQLEDFSSIYTLLQPVRHKLGKLFGANPYYSGRLNNFSYGRESHWESLRLLGKVQEESGLTAQNFKVVYIPFEAEFTRTGVFVQNIASFREACAELKLACVVPDVFLKEADTFRTLFLEQDRHLSEYGAKRVADFLLPLTR